MNSIVNDKYNKQAEEFIAKTGIKIDIELADPQTCPIWSDTKCSIKDPYIFRLDKCEAKLPHNHGLKYEATITNKNNRTMTFDYWSSIYDTYSNVVKALHSYGFTFISAEEMVNYEGFSRAYSTTPYSRAIKPSAYDILACVAADVNIHDFTFDEWCSDFGYSNDSIKAKSIYDRCCDESRELARIFSHEELLLLQEIR